MEVASLRVRKKSLAKEYLVENQNELLKYELCCFIYLKTTPHILSLKHIQNFHPFHQLQMITCNCCVHCWTQSTKCINLTWEHNCEKIEIKNRSASSDGMNRKALKRMMRMLLYPLRGLEQMAMTEMGWEVFLRLTQVSGTARWGAMSIKVQRGLLSICEKLINSKVIFIRSPSCCYSYIASRD